MEPQVPLLPLPFFAKEHAMHGSEQELLQQYPSTQYPDKHWLEVLQDKPLTCAQVPTPLHEYGHSLSGSVFTAMGPHVPLEPLPFFAAVHA
jgi:hypothetical protein